MSKNQTFESNAVSRLGKNLVYVSELLRETEKQRDALHRNLQEMILLITSFVHVSGDYLELPASSILDVHDGNFELQVSGSEDGSRVFTSAPVGQEHPKGPSKPSKIILLS